MSEINNENNFAEDKNDREDELFKEAEKDSILNDDLEDFDLSDDFDDENDFNSRPINNSFRGNLEQINYTPVAPYEKKPISKGLKVFSLVLAAVIAVSAACTVGYTIGKNSSTGKDYIAVGLASKPKNNDELTAAQVYEKTNESIVGISVYNKNGSVSGASGVIYSKDGYLVTNDHIYSEIGAPKFKVYTYDGKEYEAEYVAGDSVSDLAVLKIKGGNFKPATFGNSKEIIHGETVVAIGRPTNPTDKSSISKGIISAVSRRVQTTSNYSASLIQTDSAINPGSSGGALVNMYGQVIGITSSKLAGVEYDAVGFAIPTVMMKRVVEQLISDGGVVDRAKLGITYTEINSITAEMNGSFATGLGIVSVGDDSDLYGKVSAGDIITHINGNKIYDDDYVLDFIENSRAGDKATFTVAFAKTKTSKDFTVTFKSNVGQSSYSESIEKDKESDKTFDFPDGE